MTTRWSLHRRILIASAVAMIVALAAGVAALAWTLDRRLTAAALGAASARAAEIGDLVADGHYTARESVVDLPADGMGLQVLDASGRVAAASDPAVATVPLSTVRPAAGQSTIDLVTRPNDTEQHLDRAVVRGLVDPAGAHWTLVVAPAMATVEATVEQATTLLSVSAVVLTALLVWLVHRIVRSALGPVERLRRQVAAISRAGTGERVSVPPADDEIANLALTMNAMLDRMAGADARTRRFLSDASHELRSPIATLRATLETAPPTPDRALMLGETLRLQSLVDDLFTLSRADDHGLGLRRDEVDLDDVVDTEVRRLRTVTGHRVGAHIEPARVRGDGIRLAQVLRNLTDNALRHAVGSVTVTLTVEGPVAVVHVDNDGPPIPAADRDVVFDRFVRLDAARARESGGSGLGLAIARALATEHGGTLTTGESPSGRCRFTLRLPLEAAAGG